MGSQGKRWEVKSRQKYKDTLTREILLDATARKISDYKLSVEINVPVDIIYNYRKKQGIPSARADSEVAKIRATPLTTEEMGLLVGAVLGDGCLSYSKKRNEAYFTVMHGVKQKEYVYYKYEKLKRLCLMNVTKVKTCGYANGTGYYFSTIWHPGLANLYKLLYPEGKKIVTKEILNLLTIEGFAWWIFDDGSLSTKLQQYTLATCQFPLEQQKIIREYLFKKLGIYSTIVKSFNKISQKVFYSLYIPKRSNEILSDYLKPFAVPCMNYKIYSAPQRLIREASQKIEKKIESDLHSDMKSDTEMISPLLLKE